MTNEVRGDRLILDSYGGNSWERHSLSIAPTPRLLNAVCNLGLVTEQITTSTRSISHEGFSVRMLDRWESKFTTRRFGG